MDNEHTKNITLDDQHKTYWEEPKKHALLKEDGTDYYSIFTIAPRLAMMLCDDFEYSQALATRMIEAGVVIFNDFTELSNASKKV